MGIPKTDVDAEERHEEMQQELPRQVTCTFKRQRTSSVDDNLCGEFKNNNKQIDKTKEDASEITTKEEPIKRVPQKGIVIKEPLETLGAKLDATGNDECDPGPASNDKGKKPMEPKLKNNSELNKDLEIADTKKGAHEQTSGVNYSIMGQYIDLYVWWDIQNCSIPKGVPPGMVKTNVLMSLRQLPLNIRWCLRRFVACGDFNLILNVREGLHYTGVQLLEVPSECKDSADDAIICDMLKFVLDKPPPAIVMLISGDVDFAVVLNRICELGYLVIVAIPSIDSVSCYLLQAGSYVFNWPSMACGKGQLIANRKTGELGIVATHEQTYGVKNLTVSHPALNLQNRSSPCGYPLVILWDVHSCRLPRGMGSRMVGGKVRMCLEELPFRWRLLDFTAYADFNFFSSIRKGLVDTGVRLIDVPSERKQTAIKNTIICDMYEFADIQPSPAYIMLISGNLHFAQAIYQLGDRDYRFIIVAPSGVDFYLLHIAGEHVYYWPEVLW